MRYLNPLYVYSSLLSLQGGILFLHPTYFSHFGTFCHIYPYFIHSDVFSVYYSSLVLMLFRFKISFYTNLACITLRAVIFGLIILRLGRWLVVTLFLLPRQQWGTLSV